MQRLSSENLPGTIDGGRSYLAMEYIDGITLDTPLTGPASYTVASSRPT